LERTIGAVKATDDGRLMWLEEGKLISAAGASTWVRDIGGSGWLHIYNNHYVKHDFDYYGPQYVGNEQLVKALILDAARNGYTYIRYKPNKTEIWRIYEVPGSGGEYLSVLTGSNGYIVSIEATQVV
jgi:hypothetical protein